MYIILHPTVVNLSITFLFIFSEIMFFFFWYFLNKRYQCAVLVYAARKFLYMYKAENEEHYFMGIFQFFFFSGVTEGKKVCTSFLVLIIECVI